MDKNEMCLRVLKGRAVFRRGIYHFWHRVYSSAWVSIRKDDYCPLCGEKFVKDESFYVMVSSSKSLPNCFIHYKCAAHNDSVGLLFIDFNSAVEKMHRSYQKQNRAWRNK